MSEKTPIANALIYGQCWKCLYVYEEDVVFRCPECGWPNIDFAERAMLRAARKLGLAKELPYEIGSYAGIRIVKSFLEDDSVVETEDTKEV